MVQFTAASHNSQSCSVMGDFGGISAVNIVKKKLREIFTFLGSCVAIPRFCRTEALNTNRFFPWAE